jgi:hypothetical protein
MKSAYELAMERLAKSDPGQGRTLTAAQKGRLAEIDRVYQGKLAEREIFLKQQLDKALAAQNADDFEKIKRQMIDEKARLAEDQEAEKEKVRKS